jgi:hypothetical protein
MTNGKMRVKKSCESERRLGMARLRYLKMRGGC